MEKRKRKSKVDKLIEEHSKYIANVLVAHNIPYATIELCMFHYKTAFKHGYKHGVEDTKIGKK